MKQDDANVGTKQTLKPANRWAISLLQGLWLGITLLWLFDGIDFAHVGIVMVLIWGSVLILGRPLYRWLMVGAPTPHRHLGVWALSAVLLVLCLWPVALWLTGQGPSWQNRWVWPTQAGTAVCVMQQQGGAGAERHRFIVGWPLGSVANVVLSQHDLSFAWASRAQQQPEYLADRVRVYQQQLGPYFNQARGYRFSLWLGWHQGSATPVCDFDQVPVRKGGF